MSYLIKRGFLSSVIFSVMQFSCGVLEHEIKSKENSVSNNITTKKEIYHKGFPITISFRRELPDAKFKSYEEWAESQEGFSMVNKKLVPWDELDRVNLKTQKWASQYADRHPEKTVLLHWNGREHRNDQLGNSELYFPGHWLTFPGSNLSDQLNEKQTRIKVMSTDSFGSKYAYREEEWPGQFKHKPGSFQYPILLVVELDEAGNRLWDNYEYVKILDIDVETNELIVERGKQFSKARAFKKGSYIAPISTRLGNEGVFDYNDSALCPKDKNGKTALDVMHDELLGLLGEDGPLNNIDGIAFDVLQWKPRSPKVDSNCDGIADGGIVEGVDEWRLGVYNFMLQLRQSLGDNKLITCDGNNMLNQKGIGIFNGIESEGLVEHNDGFRGFAKTINVYTYWNQNNPLPNQFNYIVDKFRNRTDQKNQDDLRRLLIGTASCLGAGITTNLDTPISEGLKVDEIIAGKNHTYNWLGRPVGEMMHYALHTKDILEGRGTQLEESFLKNIKANNCTIRLENGELTITPVKNKPASIEFINLPQNSSEQDVTFYMDIISKGALPQLPIEIPRFLNAHAEGLPIYEKNKNDNDFYNEQLGLFGPNWQKQTFYYRNCANSLKKLTLEFEGHGSIAIKNISMHYAPLAIMREFENGVVLVNPSFNEVEFDVSVFKKQLKKIEGLYFPKYNDGSNVGTSVKVPSLNALFLKNSN